jgi:hypothetical protein
MMHKYLNPKNYITAAGEYIPFILSHVAAVYAKQKVDHYGNMPLKHEPVFIIGAPRTGSTILYQALTNLYDVLYVDNLACKFHRNFFFGLWLSNKIYCGRPHNNYLSEQGDTSGYGLHAPSECGRFWYRWLPKERHFIDYADVTDTMIGQIRSEIAAVINYFDKPFLFKNLNAGQRLRLIRECFPKAGLVYIKRDPFYTVQSILRTRAQKNIRPNHIWSIKPPNYKALLSLDEVSMVTAQVYYLEKQIEKDLSIFDRNNIVVVNYESMAKDFQGLLSRLEKTFKLARNNPGQTKIERPVIRLKNRVTIDDASASRIRHALEKFDWKRNHGEANLSRFM